MSKQKNHWDGQSLSQGEYQELDEQALEAITGGADPQGSTGGNTPQKKRKRDMFVKVLEKAIDCVTCNVEMKSPRGEPNSELANRRVQYAQLTDNLAAQNYPEEWKNHPDYIQEQNQKAHRGALG